MYNYIVKYNNYNYCIYITFLTFSFHHYDVVAKLSSHRRVCVERLVDGACAELKGSLLEGTHH